MFGGTCFLTSKSTMLMGSQLLHLDGCLLNNYSTVMLSRPISNASGSTRGPSHVKRTLYRLYVVEPFCFHLQQRSPPSFHFPSLHQPRLRAPFPPLRPLTVPRMCCCWCSIICSDKQFYYSSSQWNVRRSCSLLWRRRRWRWRRDQLLLGL